MARPRNPATKPIKTYADRIREAMTDLGGEATVQDVIHHLHQKYSCDPVSLSTSMSDLAVNGPDSSSYPMKKRFLERVERGRYRLITR